MRTHPRGQHATCSQVSSFSSPHPRGQHATCSHVSSFSSPVAALRISAEDGRGLFIEPEEGVAGRITRVEIGDAGVVAWGDAIHGEVLGCCARCGEDVEEEEEEEGERGEGEWEGARHWEMGAGFNKEKVGSGV